MIVSDAREAGRVIGVLLFVALVTFAAVGLMRWLRPRVRGFFYVLALIPVVLFVLGALAVAGSQITHPHANAGASPLDAQLISSTAGVPNPFTTAPTTATIYFIPFDPQARALLAKTVPSLRKWLPAVVNLKTIPTTRPGWVDASRQGEWNAEAVANYLLASFRSAQGNRNVLLMGVTSQALFDPATPAYAFVFGFLWWHIHKPQFAAVYGTQPMRVYQPEREQARLTKMMLRYIGEIVCNLRRNNNPRSVLYQTILGTPDLDRMVATLPATCRR